MKRESMSAYRAPQTGAPLNLLLSREDDRGEVVEGTLQDASNGIKYPILNGLPRFVESTDYVESFGYQWNKFRLVQLDSVNGSTLSLDRFFQGTNWTPEDLSGARVLEAGCGAGRFTEILLSTGADVWSFDYSRSVDAAWLTHRGHTGLNLCQADI